MNSYIYLLLGLTILINLIIVLQFVTKSRRSVKHRLHLIQDIDPIEDQDEMKKPFEERVLLPIYQMVFKFIERITPKKIAEDYQSKIILAGLSDTYTPNRLIVLQVLLSLISMIIFYQIFELVKIKNNVLLVIFFGIMFFMAPYLQVKTKAQSRQNNIRRALPDMLDMLYISVEAGLSFDSAMKKTSTKMKGPLSDEIIKAMDDISRGRNREEALRNIGKRSQVEEVASFITSVIQSEILGSNIANMLRIQSTVMREKRKQRAEEEAAKMPLKMLFPMVFLLFPALFVIILGPALLNIIKVMGQM